MFLEMQLSDFQQAFPKAWKCRTKYNSKARWPLTEKKR